MVGKSGTSNLAESSDLSKKIATLAKKAKLKSEQDIITTLQAFEVSMVKVIFKMMEPKLFSVSVNL